MTKTAEEIREQKRLYQRAYRDRDRDKLHERNRDHYERHRLEVREQQARYREGTRETRLAQQRDYYARNRESRLAAYERLRHGPFIAEDKAAMWAEQEGLCYLCGDEMDLAKARVDHDHRCCPGDRSCRVCRRGLACDPCNKAIGMANDDPERLSRMASSLETALRAFEERKAATPCQPELLNTGSLT